MSADRFIPGYDYTNSPYIRGHPPGPNPPVDGSNIWRLSQPTPVTITDFQGGYVGQTITITFDDANTAIAQTGNIRLGGGSFQSNSNSILTLIDDGSHWIETARA